MQFYLLIIFTLLLSFKKMNFLFLKCCDKTMLF
nr:MAG TPA: hypothetical protein [Caudoviricetes sp.]